jgi:pimeloyl-ACP methyl ester carboxylesterase
LKQILLFIHGAGGNSKIWERQIKFFGNAITIDLPGHGVGEGKKLLRSMLKK